LLSTLCQDRRLVLGICIILHANYLALAMPTSASDQ